MRVFVDTNVLVSYLLGPGRDSAVSLAMRAGIQGVFDMVVSREILSELTCSISDKPYLRSRISESDLLEFLDLVTSIAVILDPFEVAPLNLSRDSADNFVLLQATVTDADFILTGDRDLLVLDAIGHTRIVDPTDFLTLLTGAKET